MPMPLSATASSTQPPPSATLRTRSATSPSFVNLQALLKRLSRISCHHLPSGDFHSTRSYGIRSPASLSKKPRFTTDRLDRCHRQRVRPPRGRREGMILEKNVFVERVLPGSVIRRLSEEEMAAYRRPFANPGEDRRPTLTWPRMIPIEGKPADVMKVVENYAAWLADTDVPKLFINADPGSILVGRQRELCRAWPNQTEVTVKGRHFVQEDSPDEIGEAVADFVRRVRSQ